jgi:hypothetical protein
VQRPQRSEDERRGRRRAPAHPDAAEETTPFSSTYRKARTGIFTIPVGGARLEGNEGPDQMPFGLWRTR